MTQEIARKIIQNLPNLYNLQTLEEEAILTLLTPKTIDFRVEGYDDRAEFIGYCPNCGEYLGELGYCNDKFCKNCGQPLANE